MVSSHGTHQIDLRGDPKESEIMITERPATGNRPAAPYQQGCSEEYQQIGDLNYRVLLPGGTGLATRLLSMVKHGFEAVIIRMARAASRFLLKA
jgi:hypothetical protein